MSEIPTCYEKRLNKAFVRLGRAAATAMAISEEFRDNVTINIDVHGMFKVKIRRIGCQHQR